MVFGGGRYLIGYAEVGVSTEIFFQKKSPKGLDKRYFRYYLCSEIERKVIPEPT